VIDQTKILQLPEEFENLLGTQTVHGLPIFQADFDLNRLIEPMAITKAGKWEIQRRCCGSDDLLRD
jgi:hypothetical protein